MPGYRCELLIISIQHPFTINSVGISDDLTNRNRYLFVFDICQTRRCDREGGLAD